MSTQALANFLTKLSEIRTHRDDPSHSHKSAFRKPSRVKNCTPARNPVDAAWPPTAPSNPLQGINEAYEVLKERRRESRSGRLLPQSVSCRLVIPTHSFLFDEHVELVLPVVAGLLRGFAPSSPDVF